MKQAANEIVRLTLLAFLTCALPAAEVMCSENTSDTARKTFDSLRSKNWDRTFFDPCTSDWSTGWFLDGKDATVTNDDTAMTIDTAHGFAVLWTRQEFRGDLRIEYDFQRVDRTDKGVNIIYIQATGDEQNGHVEDIMSWAERRTRAAMSDYHLNMHTYHVSYAAFPADYIRGRRYLPEGNRGLKGTKLTGEYLKTGLFDDQEWIHITLIKQAKSLWMEFRHPDKTLLCHFANTDKPAVEAGRIGLRLMPSRRSRFRNFEVMEAGAASASRD